MNKIRYHICLSKNVIYCKNCKKLIIAKYLDNILCEKCDKQYNQLVNNIMF